MHASGIVGLFNEIESAVYLRGLKLNIDSRKTYKIGLLRVTKENVLFTITGSEEQIRGIKQEISVIKAKWGIS